MGRDPVRLAASGRVLDKWAATPPEAVMLSHQEAASELAAIKNAISTGDWAALETYGGLNPAIKRACVLEGACAGRPEVAGGDHDWPDDWPDVALDAGAGMDPDRPRRREAA